MPILHTLYIKDRGKIPSFVVFYQLFLGDSKVKKLDKFLAFFDGYLDVPSTTLQLTPSVFSK